METAVIVLIVGVAALYIIRRIYKSVKEKTGSRSSPGGICSSCGRAATCVGAPTNVGGELEKDKTELFQPVNKI
jgi:hypothetical protein